MKTLRPVSYTYSINGQRGIGLIAEEVSRVFPELVVYDQNKPISVRYDLLSVYLLLLLQKRVL